MGIAMSLAVVVGISLGVFSALHPNSTLDNVLSTLAYAGYAIPNFVLGILLIFVFAVWLDLLPTQGMGSLRASEKLIGDRFAHLILPVTTLAFNDIVIWLRYQRNSLLDILSEDYVRTARAKGLSAGRVIFRHAWRNSLIPVITLLGYSLPRLITGSYVVETFFSWPGIGNLSVTAIYQRDYTVVMAILMVSSVMVISGNLLADVCYSLADPRIRHEA
jgi:peptide/nickel transport system permease protein